MNQFEKSLFVLFVELKRDFILAQLDIGEELKSTLSEVNVGPIIMFFVEDVIELSFKGFPQQSHDLLEVPFDVKWSENGGLEAAAHGLACAVIPQMGIVNRTSKGLFVLKDIDSTLCLNLAISMAKG